MAHAVVDQLLFQWPSIAVDHFLTHDVRRTPVLAFIIVPVTMWVVWLARAEMVS
jgi:hypothetical protein